MILLFFKRLYILYALISGAIVYPIIYFPSLLLKKYIYGENTNYTDILCAYILKLFNATHKFHNDSHPHIEKGILLANHRSWTDCSCETYYGKTSLLGLNYAYIIQLLNGLTGYLENRYIPITIHDKRDTVFKKLITYMNTYNLDRVAYYPEGERSNHMHVKDTNDAKNYIKPGLLKSIYEHKSLPVQIMITNNKEQLFNEKNLTCTFGVTLTTYLSQEINPSDYATFDDFYTAVAKEWHYSWYKVYNKE